jgi:sulfopyruvate decarboxylase beta subunit
MTLSISEEIIKLLKQAEVNFFATYPCAKIRRLYDLVHLHFHSVPVTKEEEGVGICAGAALAGSKPAMLIQSTGLGNMINALCSLTLTYELPLLILASWRGVYQEKISAQIPLGKRLTNIIDALGFDYHIIQHRNDLPAISRAIKTTYEKNKIQIVLFSPQLWEDEKAEEKSQRIVEIPIVETEEEVQHGHIRRSLNRFEVLQTVESFLEGRLVICNIGLPSRELYQVKHQSSNFYMMGSLGLASSIGLGVALSTSNQVVVIDGDGSLLSNLGTLATITQEGPQNLTILAIDNGVHGSTGNQSTATSRCVDLAMTAKGLGFERVFRATSRDEINSILSTLADGPNFVHILARPGNVPVSTIPLAPSEIRDSFMKKIKPK